MARDVYPGRESAADTDPADSPGAPGDEAAAQSTGKVVEVALKTFGTRPFGESKLDGIAREAGMSKRMIHYYFGDKRGLYQAALTEAVRRLQPDDEEMRIDSNIPVEGVRVIVDALHRRFLEHPEAVAMIQTENVQHVLDLEDHSPLVDHTPVLLNLDRLLLLGQDSGAFRPGISAFDVYYLIAALLSRRVTDQATSLNLYGADLSDPANVEGTHRMAVDAVLAFLTANISDGGHESYLDASADSHAPEQQDHGAAVPSIYGDDDTSSVIYG